jgi:hypothetical protein
MNRQRLILFILVIVFGCAAFWSYNAMPRPKTVSTLAKKTVQQSKPAVAAPDKPVRTVVDDGTTLKIARLDNEMSGFKGYHRNIFKPVFVDEMKVVKLPAAAIKPPPKLLPPPVAPSAPPIVQQPETAPLARFTFLGFLKKGSVKTIFLANDKDILLVKKGDTVAGRYEATDISDQALTLTVTDTGDEIVIPLVENRPLATPK